MVTAGEIAGTMLLDPSNVMSTFDAVEARTQAFLQTVAPLAMIPIGADASQFTTTLQAAQQQAQQFAQAQAAAAQSAQQLGAATGTTDQTLAAMLGTLTQINQTMTQVAITNAAAAQSLDQISAKSQQADQQTQQQTGSTLSLNQATGLLTQTTGILGVNMSGVTQTMNVATNAAKALDTGAGGAAAGLGGLAAAAAVVVVPLALATAGLMSNVDAAYQMSQATGLSIATSQQFGFAMQSIGLDAEAGSRGIMMMERNAGDLNDRLAQGLPPTGRYATALADLNINAEAFSSTSLTADDRLRILMDHFATAGPNINKTQVAMDVMGRSGAQFAAIMSQGSGALDTAQGKIALYNAGLSDAVPEVMKLHESQAELSTAFTGFEVEVGGKVIPIMTDFLTTTAKGVVVAEDLGAAIGRLFAIVGQIGGDIIGVIERLKQEWDSLPGPLKAAFETAAAAASPVVAALGVAKDATDALHSALDQMEGNATKSQQAAAAAYQSGQQDVDKYVLSLKEQGKSTNDLSIIEAQHSNAAKGAYQAAADAVETYVRAHSNLSNAEMNEDAEFQKLVAARNAASGAVDEWSAQLTKVQQQLQAENSQVSELTSAQTVLSGVQQTSTQQMDSLVEMFTKANGSTQAAAELTTELSDAYRIAHERLPDLEADMDKLTVLADKGTGAEKTQAAATLELVNALLGLGDAAPGIARVQANLALLAPVTQQIDAELRTATETGKKFTADLAADSAVGSAAFAQNYGAAAASIAAGMQTASASAVQSWRDADTGVATALSSLEAGIDADVDASTRKQLEDRVTAAQAQASTAKQGADDAIAAEQSYLSAVEKSAQAQVTLRGELFDAQLKLTHMTAQEQAAGLGDRLQAEITTVQDIQRLEDQLKTTTDADTRATLEAQVSADQQRLQNIKEDIREIGAEITADTKLDTIDLNLNIDPIKAATQAQADYNDAVKAGIAIQKELNDLTKTVKGDMTAVTQQQVDSLHAATEASRAQAQADVAAASAAQQNWLAVAGGYDVATKASRAYSQAEIESARATATAAANTASASTQLFNENLAAETTATQALTAQTTAQAAAERTLAADRKANVSETTRDAGALSLAFTVLGDNVSSSQRRAASDAATAYHDAFNRVQADDVALTGVLGENARKAADANRTADLATLTDATTTYHQIADAATAQAKAEIQSHTDARNASKSLRDLEINDINGAAAQQIGIVQDADSQIAAIDQALVSGTLTPDQVAVANGAREMYRSIADDAGQAAQQQEQDEKAVVDANRNAQEQIVAMQGNIFDAKRKEAHMSYEEQALGLGQWLNAEISTDTQIQALYAQLYAATDAIQKAAIQQQIDNLRPLLDYYAEMVREIEARAQDWADQLKNQDTKASQEFASIATQSFQQVQQAVESVSDVINGLQDQLNQLLGVVNVPSTEELKLTTMLDGLKIQMAQVQEAGGDTTALAAQIATVQSQVDAYKNERDAMADLAKAQGDLASGTTNSITVMRGAVPAISSMEEALAKAQSTTVSLYGTGGQADTWATQTVGAVDRVTQAWTKLTQAQLGASSGSTTTTGSQSGGGSVQGGSLSGGAAGQASSPGLVGIGMSTLTYSGNDTGGSGIPQYALGTNYVPNTGLAVVHEGEVILPPGTPIGQQGAPFRGGVSIGTLSIPVAVQGTNLTADQVRAAVRKGVQDGIAEKFDRDVTLGGFR